MTPDRAEHYRPQHVHAGDLVFTCWGTIGQVGRIPEDGPFSEYIISNKQLKLRPDLIQADSRFLFYYFASPAMVEHIKGRGIGSAVPGINLGILKSLPVVLPPLPTQQKIAAILSAYDDLIANNNNRIKIIAEMADRTYREWFVDFRYPAHEDVPLVDSELGPIPQSWDVVRFTDLADILSGGTPRTTEPTFWNGPIPFFTPRDAPSSFVVLETEKHITEEGLARCNSQLYPSGTVFVTARGTVGRVAMAGLPMAMNQSCYAVRGCEGVDQEYLLLALTAQVDYLRANTGGATFDTIIVDTFHRMRILRAPRPLLKRFSDLVRPLVNEVRVLSASNQILRSNRDLLLPRLISGTIDVEQMNIAVEASAA